MTVGLPTTVLDVLVESLFDDGSLFTREVVAADHGDPDDPDDPSEPSDPGAPDAVCAALEAYRVHRLAGYRDLVAALLLPAGLAEAVTACLTGADHAVPVLLVADTAGSDDDARQGVRAARDLVAEDDRVEVVGVRLPIPSSLASATGPATDRLLETLDFSAPAWIEVCPGSATGWRDALQVIAEDGAEHVTVLTSRPTREGSRAVADDDLAAVLLEVVERDLVVRVAGPTGPGGGLPAVRTGAAHGWLNVLVAVHAAHAVHAKGDAAAAPVARLAAVLAERRPEPLLSALASISAADAAAVRRTVHAVQPDDVAAAVQSLALIG